MDFLRVRNWERWQSYRSDRTPPWIKLHRGLLLNPEWQALSDPEKGALVSIFMLAAERNGCVPNDALLIRKLCNLEITPNLERFLSLQWLEKINKRRRRTTKDHSVLEERREERQSPPEIRISVGACPSSPAPDGARGPAACPFARIVSLYHETLPQLPQVAALTDTRKANIRARWANEFERDLDLVRQYFDRVAESRFLTGRRNGRGDRPFRPDLEWLMKPGNVVKVVEGRYDDS